MADLYIYYRVRDAHAQQLAPRVHGMQMLLSAAHAVQGQLKRRPDSKDGLQTWMEVYPGTAPGFGSALTLAVENAGLSELIEGPRHTEVFVDVAPCA